MFDITTLKLVSVFHCYRYIFFKDDFLVEVDGDVMGAEDVVIKLPSSCQGDSVGENCSDSSFTARESILAKSLQPKAAEADNTKERACDSLIMCIITTLNQGLRNGGGIGDILRAPSSKVDLLLIEQQFGLRRRPVRC